jgi:hypothetical protein
MENQSGSVELSRVLIAIKLGVDGCNPQIKRLPVKVLDDPTHIQILAQDIVETLRESYQHYLQHFAIDGKSYESWNHRFLKIVLISRCIKAVRCIGF